jgi:16S rRNA pseudouridine516 synthase
MRLDRYLANAGLGSRSDVKELVREGLIAVDGKIICDSGYIIFEEKHPLILCDGSPVVLQHDVHLMLNKPAGLITAMEDPRIPTVAGLFPARYISAGIFPVGRLDRDATGLLLMTTDGTLGFRLASPRWQIWKTYAVTADGSEFNETDRRRFAEGLALAGGIPCRPAFLEITSPLQALLSIHEGKYHQVKRMMQSTGRKVTALHRLSLGPLKLDEKLAPGEYRELDEKEIHALYEAVGLAPRQP